MILSQTIIGYNDKTSPLAGYKQFSLTTKLSFQMYTWIRTAYIWQVIVYQHFESIQKQYSQGLEIFICVSIYSQPF